jgi:hypothetical protein
MIFSRILTGFGTGIPSSFHFSHLLGVLSPVRACIADITTPSQRVKFFGLSSAVQFIGFAIMPGNSSPNFFPHFF